MARINRFQDKFSASQIGTGSLYTAGSLYGRNPKGLAKALRESKREGKASFAKNLSEKDLETFKDLVGDEMKKMPTGSKSLSRNARLKIMSRAQKMVYAGKISGADKRDLRDIVASLGPQRLADMNQPIGKTATINSPTLSQLSPKTSAPILNNDDPFVADQKNRLKITKKIEPEVKIETSNDSKIDPPPLNRGRSKPPGDQGKTKESRSNVVELDIG
jgi:hypothetical protein